MNTLWTDFLLQQNATLNEDGSVISFGQPKLEKILIKNGPVLSSQSHQALLEIKGSDALEFLQGQLTNDVNEINDTTAQISAYCTPQAKVLAIVIVFKIENTYYLILNNTIADAIQKRLQMFVMRSEVSITNISDDWSQIGYAGEFADLDIQRLLGVKIKKEYELVAYKNKKDGVIIKLPGPYHNYLILGNTEIIKNIWQKLRNNTDPINNKDWKLLNIASGVTEVDSLTTDKYIAQFLNLDKLGAISFKKGCFAGQEVIARMHYRGKVTKRTLRIHFDEAIALEPGDIFELVDEKNKSYKFETIISNEDVIQGTLCLAITTIKPLISANGNLTTTSGISSQIEPLPYDVLEE